MKRRKVDVVIISDVHLGTYGCHAKELSHYLKSIRPGKLILNGDIIDIWQFRKRYWPKSHMNVAKQIIGMAAKGVPVYYITGNHDEMLRKFSDFDLGNFHLRDKMILPIGYQKAWIFHGDIFDASIQQAKWLAKMGGWGYDLLILINRLVNYVLEVLGRERMSLSKKIKNSVKRAVSYISDFEETAAELAMDQNYDYVICGHIHQPQMKVVKKKNRRVTYLNSGDWIENLSALEYHHGKWRIYRFEEEFDITKFRSDDPEEESWTQIPDPSELLEKMYLIGHEGDLEE
ncbi:UDP-2,3-diacylglucosamine diphosphatase [Cryomorphaceae bacterium]|nr:UDP-2,3-diacylglucosamine diphosphatase [Cryomorphaceae bacterium]